jgi:CRP/FNR family cyclic AMP-dependent transcriptional regulator
MADHRNESQPARALLDSFTPDEWQRFLSYTETSRFRQGDVIIAQGQVDRTLYVLLQGSLDVYVSQAGQAKKRSIDLLLPGAAFGEMAFFDQSPRSASVEALEDGALLCLRAEVFDLMRRREPELACALAIELGRALSLRFRRFLNG